MDSYCFANSYDRAVMDVSVSLAQSGLQLATSRAAVESAKIVKRATTSNKLSESDRRRSNAPLARKLRIVGQPEAIPKRLETSPEADFREMCDGCWAARHGRSPVC